MLISSTLKQDRQQNIFQFNGNLKHSRRAYDNSQNTLNEKNSIMALIFDKNMNLRAN